MKKIIQLLKNHKKVSIGTAVVILLAIVACGIMHSCPSARFNRYCKDAQVCTHLAKILTPVERDAFIAMAEYREKTGKQALDSGILKYADMKDITEVNLKIRAASAEAVRQNALDNMLPQEQLSGNRDCLRQVYMNELSNEEVLFLQTPQAKNVNILKANPQLQDVYVIASSKLMRCMNETIQKQFLNEVNELKKGVSEAKK